MEGVNKVYINVESNKISINPMIYGNFIEHLGECIHNGIWISDLVKVPLVKDNPFLVGLRQDLLKSVKDMKPTVLRAFGGCYSDVYHWKDAIGPRDTRKKVKNLHWGLREKAPIEGTGPDIDNQFGTDEFLSFCEEIGAKPYLNVNYGTGTPEEAADWVEYCNGSIDTEYGALRNKNGREKPYNVKIWGIANEIYGIWEMGYERSPENYAKKYLEFAKKMREKDPTIKLVACGWESSKWNKKILENIGEKWIDYLSIHRYFPYLLASPTETSHPDHKECYYALMASTPLITDYINNTWEDITSTLGKETHVRIAFDEWGVWYLMRDLIRTNFNLQDGIWTALILMTFQKMSDKCPIANWAQLINCIGVIQTDPDGLILTPVYLTLKLIANHIYQNLIEDVRVNCITFESLKYGRIPKRDNVPYIECSATINNDGNELSIAIINKHITDNIEVELNIDGFIPKKQGKIMELNSKSPFDYNTIENRNKIKILERQIKLKSNMKLNLSAHSLIILKLSKK